MGYMRHHAIIVSSWSEMAMKAARDKAEELDCHPSEMMHAPTNGIDTFLIPPDGSKEGWPESDEGDRRREHFLNWINLERYDDDGSSPYDWAWIQYGDDDADNRMLLHNDSMKAIRSWEVRGRAATTQEHEDG